MSTFYLQKQGSFIFIFSYKIVLNRVTLENKSAVLSDCVVNKLTKFRSVQVIC
jgi:hypothetical protein